MSLVLSQRELARIRKSIEPPSTDKDTSRSQKRAELKKKSDDRVKNWPNTLEALRLKKESARREREEIAELKRQDIDREV